MPFDFYVRVLYKCVLYVPSLQSIINDVMLTVRADNFVHNHLSCDVVH